jgi:hypothetical protein
MMGYLRSEVIAVKSHISSWWGLYAGASCSKSAMSLDAQGLHQYEAINTGLMRASDHEGACSQGPWNSLLKECRTPTEHIGEQVRGAAENHAGCAGKVAHEVPEAEVGLAAITCHRAYVIRLS